MKIFLTLILALTIQFGFAQDTIKQIDTTNKVITVYPLPVEMFNILKTKGSGIEATMYQSSKTFTLPGLKGTNYFLSFLQGVATTEFNTQNTAYLMVLVDDDFYMDAEVSISDTSSYIIFKKDGVKYYNRLTPEGVAFFKRFM
ncbi:hypothetical protein N9488_00375 [Flavobacteriales bacterium]|nr:hypothetical protein [Flavobacteriales bacterium]